MERIIIYHILIVALTLKIWLVYNYETIEKLPCHNFWIGIPANPPDVKCVMSFCPNSFILGETTKAEGMTVYT